MRTVTILGATGSIGVSTLDVVERHPDRFRVHALTANTQVDKLIEMAMRCRPDVLVVADPSAGPALERAARAAGLDCQIGAGEADLVRVAGTPGIDTVMAAIVGAAGLAPTLAAAVACRHLLLANKESIVMAGHLFVAACRRSGVRLLPIDSEHNALFQCLAPQDKVHAGVRRLILTASGGPFRTTPVDALGAVTPDQACAHPKWSMGRKISVDSATMMNKGLELIEARFLFDVAPERLSVLIHPQSIVHSLVEYVDGSVLAQLGNPDMRTPIAHALGHPERIDSGVPMLDLARAGRLDFEEPDLDRFPCLRLAMQVLGSGGAAPCVMNAANEAAVAAFLDERIGYTRIEPVVRQTVEALDGAEPPATIDAAFALDARSRQMADRFIARMASRPV